MSDSWNLATVSWLFVSTVEVLLLVFVLYRRQYRSHPLFTLYVFSLVLQTTVAFLAYRRWGPRSWQYFDVAWLSQASVVCARWLAVVEIARKVFVRYSGVWRLASIILLTMSLGVLLYSILAAGSRFGFVVLAAGRGVELCIALFIVAVFVSARYYRLPIVDAERQLAIGFCLYSCVWVVNITLFEAWRQSLGEVWDTFLTIAFLASVVIWVVALRAPARESVSTSAPALSPEQYAQLSTEVSSRLVALNDRLNQLFRSGGHRS